MGGCGLFHAYNNTLSNSSLTMKHIIIIALFLFLVKQGFGQFGYFLLNFEDSDPYHEVIIDYNSNPSNIWVIGDPDKPTFDSAKSLPNCIFTGDIDFYPPNDTSSFYIMHIADQGYEMPHTCGIDFDYKIESDSLKDFGMIDLSLDNGKTWFDFFEDERIGFDRPILTGNIPNWTYANLFLHELPYFYDIEYGDTIIYRFTFISDEVDNELQGWMIDNIIIYDEAEGITTQSLGNINAVLFPNPSSDFVSLSFENPSQRVFALLIYNISGTLIHTERNIIISPYKIDLKDIGGGNLLFFKLFSDDNSQYAFGKILRIH